MRITFFLLSIFWCLSTVTIYSQRKLTLQECVQIAQERSIDVKSSQLGIARAESNLMADKQSRYPNLNGSANWRSNWGLSLDPATNVLRNININSNNFSVNSNITVFNAGAINNSIKSSKYSLQAAEQNVLQVKENIALSVVQAYLAIMLAEDNLQNVEGRVAIAQNQLDRTLAMIEAGTMNAAARYEFESQLATEQEAMINAENQLQLAILDLRNLMLLEEDEDISIARPDLDRIMVDEADILTKSFDEIYQMALSTQPSVKAGEYNIKAAEMNEKVAKSSLYPSLGLAGSLGTAWTNQGQRIANITQIPDVEVTDVTIDGNPAVLEVPTVMVDAELENTPYVDQLDNNLGYGFGLSLNVPIYNNYTRKNNLAQARISKEQTELDNLSLRQTIRNNVLRAMADAKGAQKRFVAAEKSLEASQISYENAQRRLELGGGNNFDFLVAGDNYRIAENNFLQAKYDFVFKLKVLDYWLGNPIVF